MKKEQQLQHIVSKNIEQKYIFHIYMYIYKKKLGKKCHDMCEYFIV